MCLAQEHVESDIVFAFSFTAYGPTRAMLMHAPDRLPLQLDDDVLRGATWARSGWRAAMAAVVLPAWGVLLTVGCTIMMARHTIPLPVPELEDRSVVQALQEDRDAAATGSAWMMTHVLLSTCPCSRRITTHLLERAPEPGVEEHILWIEGEEGAKSAGGDDFVARARARGFIVHQIDHERLANHYHIKAAPLLIIVGATPDELLYSGGYTSRKQGYAIQDIEVLDALRARHGPLDALPLFGCAASKELRETIDPTGWFSSW